MKPSAIDGITISLAIIGLGLIVAALTLAATCVIWFVEGDRVPDEVMERIASLSMSLLMLVAGCYCIKAVWRQHKSGS